MSFFSVIIPSFNGGEIIERCLLSVVQQTCRDYELLIQDGGSIDNTMAVIQSVQERFPHADIKIFVEKDGGVYDAMNKAIVKASGEWISFLGSDDYLYDHDVLQKVKEFLQDSLEPIDVLYGNACSPVLGSKYDGEFDAVKLTQKNICHQSIFHHRRVYQELGYYNLKYRLFSDHEFNFRCFFSKKIRTRHIDLLIAYYEDGGISSRQDDPPFRKDYKYLVKSLGYKTLPLPVLRQHCTSRVDYLKYLAKRLTNT